MVPKFRAWDKTENQWIEGFKLHFYEDGSILCLDVEDECDFPFFVENIGVTWELMQFTGLKDKNGVEIFEGDLVKVSVDNGFDYLFEELSIVKPSKFHSGLVCSLKSHEAEYRIIHAEILGYEYEVVGNIYENPELLEQANEN